MTLYSCLLALEESLFHLSRHIILLISFYFIWKLLQVFPVWDKTCDWLKKNWRYSSFFPDIASKLSILIGWDHQQIGSKRQATAEDRKSIKRPRCLRSQNMYARIIRRLLCDNVHCKVCDSAAQETAELVYMRRNRAKA